MSDRETRALYFPASTCDRREKKMNGNPLYSEFRRQILRTDKLAKPFPMRWRRPIRPAEYFSLNLGIRR